MKRGVQDNVYIPQNRVKTDRVKDEVEKSTIIVGDFNVPLLKINRNRKINKDIDN